MPRSAFALLSLAMALAAAGIWQTSGSGHASETTTLIEGPWQPLHAGSRVRLLGIASTAAGEVNGGIEIELADGWKTYWRMPGEAGVPPQFEWQGSSNTTGVRVLYPAPKRMPEAGAEVIGYKKRVVLPFAAKAATAGNPVALKLEAEFGICREICVPAQANLTLELPAATKPGPLPAVLAEAVRTVPGPPSAAVKGRPSLVSTTTRLDDTAPQIVVVARFPGAAAAADVFIEAPDSIFVPMTKRSEVQADGTVSFTSKMPPATAQDLKGKTLTLTLVGEAGAVEIPWLLP